MFFEVRISIRFDIGGYFHTFLKIGSRKTDVTPSKHRQFELEILEIKIYGILNHFTPMFYFYTA